MKKSGLLFSLLFNFSISPLFAQFESPGEIFFSSDDSKVTTAYFTAHIEGLPKYNENSWLIDLRLNAAIPNEVLKKCFWTISGPNTKLHFEDSLNSKLVRISVPFPPTSGFFWQDFKKYVITLTVLTEKGWQSLTMARKMKFEVTRASRKSLGNDFSYKVSSIWLARGKQGLSEF
jgi:hypothetical protein